MSGPEPLSSGSAWELLLVFLSFHRFVYQLKRPTHWVMSWAFSLCKIFKRARLRVLCHRHLVVFYGSTARWLWRLSRPNHCVFQKVSKSLPPPTRNLGTSWSGGGEHSKLCRHKLVPSSTLLSSGNLLFWRRKKKTLAPRTRCRCRTICRRDASRRL